MSGTRASTGCSWPGNVRNQGINRLLMARKCKEPGHQQAADCQAMLGTRASTGCRWPDNARNQGINRLLMTRQCKEPGHQQAADGKTMSGTRLSTGYWLTGNVRNQGINRLLIDRQCKEPGHQQAADGQTMQGTRRQEEWYSWIFLQHVVMIIQFTPYSAALNNHIVELRLLPSTHNTHHIAYPDRQAMGWALLRNWLINMRLNFIRWPTLHGLYVRLL